MTLHAAQHRRGIFGIELTFPNSALLASCAEVPSCYERWSHSSQCPSSEVRRRTSVVGRPSPIANRASLLDRVSRSITRTFYVIAATSRGRGAHPRNLDGKPEVACIFEPTMQLEIPDGVHEGWIEAVCCYKNNSNIK